MRLLKDIDKLYTKTLPLIINYIIGWFIGGMISLILFFAIFCGWRPFKKYDHSQHGNYTPWSPPGSEIYRDGQRVP
jgi:hypothetical protein